MALQKIFADLSVHDGSIKNVLIGDGEIQSAKLASGTLALDRVSDGFITNLLATQLRAVYPQIGNAAIAAAASIDVNSQLAGIPASTEAPSYSSRAWSNLGAACYADANVVTVKDADGRDDVINASGHLLVGRLSAGSGAPTAAAHDPNVTYMYRDVVQSGGTLYMASSQTQQAPPGGAWLTLSWQGTYNAGNSYQNGDLVLDGSDYKVKDGGAGFVIANGLTAGVSFTVALKWRDGSGTETTISGGDATAIGNVTMWYKRWVDGSSSLLRDASQPLFSNAQGVDATERANIDQLAAGLGISLNGTGSNVLSYSNTNYLNSVTTLKDATTTLDTQLKGEVDARTTAVSNVQTEVNNIETAVGIGLDGTFSAWTGSNYLDAASTIKGGISALDGAVKNVQDEVNSIETSIGSAVNSSGVYQAFSGSNYMDAATTITGALSALDSAISGLNSGSISNIQTELNDTQTGAGLGTNGAYTANNAANYISASTSLKDADDDLDTALKRVADNAGVSGTSSTINYANNNYIVDDTSLKAAIEALDAALNTVQGELNTTQSGAGLDANGGYTALGASNYLTGATSLKDADSILDARVKQNADNIGTAATGALGFSSTNYLDAQTSLKAAATTLDAKIKQNADNIGTAATGGLSFSGTNYLDAKTSLKAAAAELDSQLYSINNALDGRLDTLEAKAWRVVRGTAAGTETAVSIANGAPVIPSADAVFMFIDGLMQFPASAGGVWTLKTGSDGVDLGVTLRANQTFELRYFA